MQNVNKMRNAFCTKKSRKSYLLK